MAPRRAKILGDIKESWSRSALVLLSILIGAAALTTAVASRSVLMGEIDRSYASTRPAAAVLWLDRVDNRAMDLARSQPEVQQADARRLVRARVEVAPGEWRPLLLFGVRDFRDLRVSNFRSVSGDWPPQPGQVLVERSALTVLRAGVGEHLHVRVLGGRQANLKIGGVVYDGGQAPGWQDNSGYAYASPETLASLGLGDALDELRITVAGDRTQAGVIAQRLADRLSQAGYAVDRIEIPVREHPHADHMRAMLTLITVFGALALALAAALTAMVISGLLARQVRQIGIMKAIGATSLDIASLYVAYVLALAVPGVIAGIALGLYLADGYCLFSAEQLNIELANRVVSPGAIAFAAIVCLGVPLLAAAWPLARVVRMTAREAIHDVDVRPPNTQGKSLTLGDRTWTLGLRNTFRRPVRLALTLGALALGGAAVMTAANNYASLIGAVDCSLADRRDDLDVRLLRPLPAATLVARVKAVPGVVAAEAWGGMLVSVALPGSPSGMLGTERYGLLAIPTGSTMFRPQMAEGRMPQGPGEIVVNRAILEHEPELKVGNRVTLLTHGHRLQVRVVGLVEEVAEPHIYADMTSFDTLAGASGLAGALRVATAPHAEARVSTAVENIVAEMGSLPVLSMTRPLLRSTMVNHFKILLVLLSAAALCAIIVGGFSLGAAAGLNVLERRREIGIMRALGAPPRMVLRILLMEGAVVAFLSLVVAFLLSLPLTAEVNVVVGKRGLLALLPFVLSVPALLLWAVAAVAISILACLGPALGVLRRPAREVLATD